MSWKLMPMSPPQRGIGLDSKISRLFRRKSRIQAGSFFISEISATISRVEPLAGLEDVLRSSLRKSYLLISPMPSCGLVTTSVAMIDSPLLVGACCFVVRCDSCLEKSLAAASSARRPARCVLHGRFVGRRVGIRRADAVVALLVQFDRPAPARRSRRSARPASRA